MGKNAQRRRHNYEEVLAQALAQGRIPLAPGRVVHVRVAHDSWCGIWQGQRCDCRPEIRTEIAAGVG